MNLHSLKPAKGSVRGSKRIGRGQGSGKGGTSTRGHKGAQSRSGHKHKEGFEGGQMPLQRRVPKFGFNNPNKVVAKPINLFTLQELSDKIGSAEITVDTLIANGLAGKNDKVKVLGAGELKKALKVTVHAFSDSAKSAIEAAGGSVTVA